MRDFAALLEKEFARAGIRELAFLSVGSQGALTAAEVLATAAIAEGKDVYVGVYTRGERTNTPVVNSIRIAEQGPIPSCSVHTPSELLLFDESLYKSKARVPRQVLQGLKKGVLMVCTDKSPEEIEYPYDFEGTVATSDARRICLDVLGLNPPPFGVTALGLYAAATDTVSLANIEEAIRERFTGDKAERNLEATRRTYDSAKMREGVKIKGKRDRARLPAPRPFDEVPDYLPFESPPLLGFSEGNVYIWHEELPVWDRAGCACGRICVLVDYCPEGVISYSFDAEKGPGYRVDYEYCKGCGVCVKQCVYHTINMVKESEVLVGGRA